MEWYDSAFTHQLVRTGDIARTRDDEYPYLDDDVLYNNCSDVGQLSIMHRGEMVLSCESPLFVLYCIYVESIDDSMMWRRAGQGRIQLR